MSSAKILTPEEIRRLYMDDDVWARTSESWKALIPKINFNELKLSDESELEHWGRLQPRFNIPLDVIEQWLYPLYYNLASTNNYGWLDYDRIEFIKTELDFETLSKVNVIKSYRPYVDEGAKFNAYEGLACTEQDKNHWIHENTWRIPPIVLDVSSIKNVRIPQYAEIGGRFQLVEGHSRLGYLYAAKKSGVLIKNNHLVYLMRYK